MPLFRISDLQVAPVAQSNFETEKKLQSLVEKNLKQIFNCRFVATEFSTGNVHAGRIDTLALSEDNNPVIIEYKKVVSSELVNQSLFYLAWLTDHKGDYADAVEKAITPKPVIDWSAIRVICLAPNYKKFDLHAVQVMGPNIELWTYRLFENDTLFLEQVHQGKSGDINVSSGSKNPVMVEAGKKAALTKQTADWKTEDHIEGKPQEIQELFLCVKEFMISLDAGIEEAPKKMYVAYRTTQNIVCVEVQKKRLLLYIKLDPKKYPGPPGISRDASKIGHFGTGDLEISVKDLGALELAKPYMKLAYEKIGG